MMYRRFGREASFNTPRKMLGIYVAFSVATAMSFKALPAEASFRLLDSSPKDWWANFTFRCPTSEFSELNLNQMKVSYSDEEGVDVTKVVSAASRWIQVKIDDAVGDGLDEPCVIELQLQGLLPITRYDMCFTLNPVAGVGGDGSVCQEVRTTMRAQKKEDKVNVNLEGVALVAFVGLGLMFALMVCVFYEKAVARWVGGCAKRTARGTKAMRSRMAEAGKKNKEVEEEGAKEEKEEGEGQRPKSSKPPNGYTRPLEPPHRAGGGNVAKRGSSGSGELHDSNRTLNERIIRDALDNRPHLLKNMDAAAAVRRKNGDDSGGGGGGGAADEIEVAPAAFDARFSRNQQQHQHHPVAQYSSDRLGGRDNYGYQVSEYKNLY